jgi:ATP-dependent helicase/nuclease subunit A
MTVRAPNPEQRAAIDATGVVFVSAGAGTGKTRVIVERYLRAVCERGLSVDSVLVITYTERAAGELRARIRARLAEEGRPDLARELDGAWVSTIHGFCHRLLKAHPFEAGVDPSFRVLDESQGRVLRSEAFVRALTEFCRDGRPERLRLLATYGASGLRRIVTDVYETLRAAGRPLELPSGGGSGAALGERVAELRAAARAVLAETEGMPEAEAGRAQVSRALELLEGALAADVLLDLGGFAPTGHGKRLFAEFEEARAAVERAALDELAARDRDLLQELLSDFALAYAQAKTRESALDFEDLQLLARDLLRRSDEIREQERWRFRSIMVDEFQDTNRLQCELVDLLAGEATSSWGAAGKGGERAGRRTAHISADKPGPRGILPPAASGVSGGRLRRPGGDAGQGPVAELFFVGDEFQSIYSFRHADVEVFRERRARAGEVLPLTRNYRARPEVLSVINHLFSADFGEEFQPLEAGGRFPEPGFGPPVELLVTDKASYAESGVPWRRAEARHIAARIRGLVDSGEATPGEIVLLFAAGTDAETYEEELRKEGLPTYRATGRGYFGQQQVVDLLAYMRLLHNRYDDEALVAVLASPFVGVSNDALVLLRRSAGRRPLFCGLERELPEGLGERDRRLFHAFRQRYDRLVGLMPRLSLERLCEEIVCRHDYDLAVLARWDGRRRYANLRKLARLARSYEELRGPDVEGFVRFVREQAALSAPEHDAVAIEEGAGAVRLLTIHAAKGLEFKVVVVADAGRDRAVPSTDEILCLPDGRLGFRVADPATGKRRPALGYEDVRDAERAAREAERRRLYYVAMTRAIDRLIVSGAIDRKRSADAATPIGWVLGQLGTDVLEQADDGPVEIEKGNARILVRVDRYAPAPDRVEAPPQDGQLALFEGGRGIAFQEAPRLAELVPVPTPPAHRVRRLSYSALALFERCSYRFYAERLAGLRPVDAGSDVPGSGGLAATEIGDAVHQLLEDVDLAAPQAPDAAAAVEAVRLRYPGATDEEVERIHALAAAFCNSELAARLAACAGAAAERPFAFEHDGVLLHGRLDVLQRENGRALVVDYKTNLLEDESPDEIVERDYRLQRLVYGLACFRAGADEVEVVYQFLEQPDELVSTTFSREEVPELETELSAAIAQIQAGEFRPTPSEFACAGCPALDLVCAGPALRSAPAEVAVAG